MVRLRAAARASLAFACVVAAPAAPAAAQGQRELNFLPVAGGDSDIGIGVGGAGNYAEVASVPPGYRWRLDVAGFVTFKQRSGIILPYQDYNAQLTLPHLGPEGRIRLEVRASHTDESIARYYGLGNASPPLAPGEPIEDIEYARLHPTLSAEARGRVRGAFHVLAGLSYTYNRLNVPPNTRLAMQQATGTPEVRGLLGPNFDPHGVGLVTLEAQWDTRDDDWITRRGQFHTVRFRVSPRVGQALPYGYQRVTATTRFYWTLIEHRLRLVHRVVGDLLIGDAPFYELSRFDETPAIGGGKGVRGVPAQRYYGKVKVFGNLELVSELWSFSLWRKPFILGLSTFFDGGRVWTGLGDSNPALDGTGVGLKYGVGGGLRIQEGKTFIVRFDVAWSPDATPVGAYFNAGLIF
jgi:hypothetical protein